ncbi:MAG: serpin family protein [Wenzhouxiangellaceae bacterium]|nr:MAG: serpin family protein [Wenzhouxiangellaceae bacterium]
MFRLLPFLLFALLLVGCQPTDEPVTDPDEVREVVEPDEVLIEPNGDPQPEEAIPEEVMDEMDAQEADPVVLNQGSREFAFATFQRVIAEDDADDNLLISPHSILSALAMVYAGAEGETRTQMREALKFALDEPALHQAFQALDEALAERARVERDDDASGFELSVVNRLWGAQDEAFLPSYLELVERHYGAGIERVDFESDPEAARRQINAWVEEQTRERIQDLLPSASLNEDTRLVLVNAIYFLASWQNAFEEDQTRTEAFQRLDGSTVDARLMHRTGSYPAFMDDHTVAVSIPYLGREVSLLALKPANADADFEVWQAELGRERFDAAVAGLEGKRVALAFPRFTGDSSFRLASLLRQMGMNDAFSRAQANFERMNGVGPGVMGRSLYVDEVFHKTFIDLDEAGTEAAAATAVVMMRLTAMPVEEDPVTIRFDRPFIYAIYDHPTETILFLGRVLEPGQGS